MTFAYHKNQPAKYLSQRVIVRAHRQTDRRTLATDFFARQVSSRVRRLLAERAARVHGAVSSVSITLRRNISYNDRAMHHHLARQRRVTADGEANRETSYWWAGWAVGYDAGHNGCRRPVKPIKCRTAVVRQSSCKTVILNFYIYIPVRLLATSPSRLLLRVK